MRNYLRGITHDKEIINLCNTLYAYLLEKQAIGILQEFDLLAGDNGAKMFFDESLSSRMLTGALLPGVQELVKPWKAELVGVPFERRVRWHSQIRVWEGP